MYFLPLSVISQTVFSQFHFDKLSLVHFVFTFNLSNFSDDLELCSLLFSISLSVVILFPLCIVL